MKSLQRFMLVYWNRKHRSVYVFIIVYIIMSPFNYLVGQNAASFKCEKSFQLFLDSTNAEIESQKNKRRVGYIAGVTEVCALTLLQFIGNNNYSKYQNAKSGKKALEYWDSTILTDNIFNSVAGFSIITYFYTYKKNKNIVNLIDSQSSIPILHASSFADSLFSEVYYLSANRSGGYTIFGGINKADRSTVPLIIEIDCTGKLVEKYIVELSEFFIKSVSKISDDRYLVYGLPMPLVDNSKQILNVLISRNGEFLSKNEFIFAEGINDFYTSKNDERFVIIGLKRDARSNTILTFIEIDEDGIELNRNQLKIDQSIYINDVYLSNDNNCIITGGYRENNGTYNKAIIIKSNLAGQKIWEQTIEKENTSFVGQSITETINGSYLIALDRISKSKSVTLIDILSNGELGWTTDYSHDFMCNIHQIAQTNNGYLITGTTANLLHMSRIDSRGEIQYWSNFEFGDVVKLNSYYETENNSYIIIGTAINSKSQENETFLLKSYSFKHF